MYFFVGLKAVELIRDLVPTFMQRQQFRGVGGELMKQACLLLIGKCSLAGMPFHNHPVIGKLQWILNISIYFWHCCFLLIISVNSMVVINHEVVSFWKRCWNDVKHGICFDKKLVGSEWAVQKFYAERSCLGKLTDEVKFSIRLKSQIGLHSCGI